MDVARLLILTKKLSLINEEVKVKVDNNVFKILLMEEAQGLGDCRNSIHNAFTMKTKSSYEDSINDTENDECGNESEYEYVPESVSGIEGGGALVTEEDKEEDGINSANEEKGLDKEIQYPLRNVEPSLGFKEGMIVINRILGLDC